MFDCKPLAFLWGKFPEFYNEDNTIMLDDLRRNFVYNKQNGLVIRPFKNAHRTRDTDRLVTSWLMRDRQVSDLLAESLVFYAQQLMHTWDTLLPPPPSSSPFPPHDECLF